MIDVDIDDTIPDVLRAAFSPEAMDRLLDDLAAAARAKWISLARQQLTTAKEDYIAGIQDVVSDGGERSITLTGWLPNAVETGIAAFDLRLTLLSEGKGKTAAGGGRYRAIPFRHGGPGSAGLAGAPMGSQYGPQGASSRALGGLMSGQAAASLGRTVAQEAKRLRPSKQRRPGDRTRWGGRLIPGLAPKLAAHHSTDIFAGMVKVQHTYRRRAQNKYMTFRTISTNKRDGWIHPGITGRNLASQVDDWVQQAAPKMLSNMLKEALK
jgi:hypothetical protein